MSLYAKNYGSQNLPPLIILHGLFGMGDNWANIAKKLSEHYSVWTLDLRNHGRSKHFRSNQYAEMIQDLYNWIEQKQLKSPTILGHSMGGKIAMAFSLNYPNLVKKLIIVDIAPKKYVASHQNIFTAIKNINLTNFNTRKEVDNFLSSDLQEPAIRQFIQKNLKRVESHFEWKCNFKTLEQYYNHILSWPEIYQQKKYAKACLILKGSLSNYIFDKDLSLFNSYFPKHQIKTINDAGHWIHADQPQKFYEEIVGFSLKN